ncbi:uncharacterized protein [Takifugu rubripes]|uniref:uncharacterized protein n=1 Tax=Takifugu rubripes TaxID=31033 RepID=UPI001145B89C|nr:uncharacterized protein LOC105416951 [Takifugu rubripes]
MKMSENCSQLSRKSVELEKVQRQDQCLLLEVREKAEKLQLQQEHRQKQDAVRFQMMEDGKSVSKYRAEKWQRVELTPQLPQEELEELTTKNREVIEKMLQLKASMEAALTRIKSDSEVLLLELDKHHLELQKCRKQKQLQAGEEGKHSGQAQDTETMTNLSQSSLSFEPQSACRICQNKPPQASDTDRVSVSIHSLREQLEESTKRENQQRQEKILAIKKLHILERRYLMPAMSAETCGLKATNGTEPCENDRLRIIQPIQDCPSVTEDQPDECNNVPNPPSCSDQPDPQQKDTPSHFPDGLFRAELVHVCSSEEREEEDLRTTNKLSRLKILG